MTGVVEEAIAEAHRAFVALPENQSTYWALLHDDEIRVEAETATVTNMDPQRRLVQHYDRQLGRDRVDSIFLDQRDPGGFSRIRLGSVAVVSASGGGGEVRPDSALVDAVKRRGVGESAAGGAIEAFMRSLRAQAYDQDPLNASEIITGTWRPDNDL